MRRKPCSCDSAIGGLSSVEDALSNVLAGATRVPETAESPLLDSLGRVLAEDIVSTIDVPGFDNSAMDGYAVACAGDECAPVSFSVEQRIPAGTQGVALRRGTAARIFTGAPVPRGTYAVVMQESAQNINGRIVVEHNIERGENIRPKGNDIKRGQTVLSAGQRIGPAEIALASSVGRATLPVHRRVRVGLFFSGDELIQPGAPLEPGQIYNSNRYAIRSLVAALGCKVDDAGVVPDSLDVTCDTLSELANRNDVIVTTGGVSVGGEDHVRPAVERLGELAVWRIAMKPGKPLAAGRIGKAQFVGLPGNPVAAFVSFLLFARPLVLKLQGVKDVAPEKWRIRAGFDWPSGKSRREFLRVRLISEPSGPVAYPTPRQGSDVFTSIADADGLLEIEEGRSFSKNDIVTFIPLCGLLH